MLVFCMSPAARAEQAAPFTLGRFIPSDVWFYIHEVHNPERDFICAHWDKVIKAASECGVDVEIKRLLADSIDEDRREAFEAKWDRVIGALKAVPWVDDLGSREFAMGQRIALPMPEYIFLFRNDPAKTDEIANSLNALLETAASLTDSCNIVKKEVSGAHISSLCMGEVGSVVELLRYKDVVGFTVGKGVAAEVLALVQSKGNKGSILADATFQRAIGSVEPPEDFVQFFNIDAMFDQVEGCFDYAFERGGKDDEESRSIRKVIGKGLDHFNIVDYVVSTRQTSGLSERMTSIVKSSPEKLKKPFGRALSSGRPFERFDKFIPKNATGFMVSTTIDFSIVYNTILDFIRTEIPGDGAAVLAKWDGLQEQFGFNLDRDLFSWLGGEIISVTLPGMMGSQANNVFMIRTKNAKAAWESVSKRIDQLGQLESITVSPAPGVEAEGFVSVVHPMMMMMQVRPVLGMYEDWLVIGTKAQDVNLCLAVAKGDAPSIRKNERFMGEGLAPDGPVHSASFNDLSNMGQEMGMVFGMLGMAGGMMPDSPETRPARTAFMLMARLAPVAAQVDFFRSSASVGHFVGDGWTIEAVINYKPYVAPETEAGLASE